MKRVFLTGVSLALFLQIGCTGPQMRALEKIKWSVDWIMWIAKLFLKTDWTNFIVATIVVIVVSIFATWLITHIDFFKKMVWWARSLTTSFFFLILALAIAYFSSRTAVFWNSGDILRVLLFLSVSYKPLLIMISLVITVPLLFMWSLALSKRNLFS